MKLVPAASRVPGKPHALATRSSHIVQSTHSSAHGMETTYPTTKRSSVYTNATSQNLGPGLVGASRA